MYHLLAGAPPFTGKSLFEILQAHHSMDARPLSLVRPEVSEELAAVVGEMMAKDPAARYQTPAEAMKALDPFITGGPKAPATPAPAKLNRDRATPDVQALLHQATALPGTRLADPGGKSKPLPPRPAPPRRNRRDAETQDQPRRSMAWQPVLLVGFLLAGILGLVLALAMNEKGHDTGREVADKDAEVASKKTSRPYAFSPSSRPPRPRPKEDNEKDADPPTPLPRPGQLPSSVTNSIGMKLVLVEPGVFLMGSPESEMNHDNDELQHAVEITRPFYVGVHEVTQEQYEQVMGEKPSYFSPTGGGKDKMNGMDTSRFPVESVSWTNAVEFCRRLSGMPEEKLDERTYRLPTEAEWGYVCRGGPFFKKPSPAFHLGNSLSSPQANFDGNSPYGGADKGEYLKRTTKVGSYLANSLGVYDLHGNVREWCADWYDKEYYKRSPRRDPQGPVSGERRVLRGGSWVCHGWYCRAAFRYDDAPGDRYRDIGFRVVLVAGARD